MSRFLSWLAESEIGRGLTSACGDDRGIERVRIIDVMWIYGTSCNVGSLTILVEASNLF